MSNATRVIELEAALNDVIDYLRRLPAHPETHRQARLAESVLKSSAVAEPIYEGATALPDGLRIVAARLQGNIVKLKTTSLDRVPDDRLLAHYKDALYRTLKDGLLIKLRPHDPSLPIALFDHLSEENL